MTSKVVLRLQPLGDLADRRAAQQAAAVAIGKTPSRCRIGSLRAHISAAKASSSSDLQQRPQLSRVSVRMQVSLPLHRGGSVAEAGRGTLAQAAHKGCVT